MTGSGAGQPGVELAHRETGDGVAPAGRDPDRWVQHESAGAEQRVRDDKAGPGPGPAAPQDQVEIEHARRPALSAPANR